MTITAMIDSHCHLTDSQFSSDRTDVIARAVSAGVTRMITIADHLEDAQNCLELAKNNDHIFCTAGVHPHHASTWSADSSEQLAAFLAESDMVAVGEIGLDYHYLNSPKAVQQEAFAEQLAIAKQLDLPAVVHCREAIEDIRPMLLDYALRQAVIHCCTEPWAEVEPLVEAGYWLSFTGIATYPKSDAIRDTIMQCPMDQLMIETDAPYLAPVPQRGQRNEPAFVVEVAQCIADVKGLSLAAVDEKTTSNAVAFFGLPS